MARRCSLGNILDGARRGLDPLRLGRYARPTIDQAGEIDMKCVRCDHDSPSEARFCAACGAVLQTSAASRGWLPPQPADSHLAKGIDRIVSGATLGEERKQVTVLFADIKGSMELLADRDPEEARAILDPVLEILIEAVHRYQGTVNQVMGDGIMTLFGAPRAQEDHAVRACYAALRMQESVKRYADEVWRREGVTVRVRVGMDSGEVVLRSIVSDLGTDYSAIGQTTHRAARMEQMADPGSTFITLRTHALAEGFIRAKALGPLPVRGITGSVEVFELTGVDPVRSRLHAAAAHGLSPLVNRAAEVEQIHRALARAVDGHGSALVLVGEPGVGKSRLVWELTHSEQMHEWLVLESRAAAHAMDIPYFPVRDLLQGYFQIDAGDDVSSIRQKVAARIETLGAEVTVAQSALLALLDALVDDARWRALDPAHRRQQIIEAIRLLLLAESRTRPALVVFEDSQWADVETRELDGRARRPVARRSSRSPSQLPTRKPSAMV